MNKNEKSTAEWQLLAPSIIFSSGSSKDLCFVSWFMIWHCHQCVVHQEAGRGLKVSCMLSSIIIWGPHCSLPTQNTSHQLSKCVHSRLCYELEVLPSTDERRACWWYSVVHNEFDALILTRTLSHPNYGLVESHTNLTSCVDGNHSNRVNNGLPMNSQ